MNPKPAIVTSTAGWVITEDILLPTLLLCLELSKAQRFQPDRVVHHHELLNSVPLAMSVSLVGPGIPDQFPSHHTPVPTIHGVGEETGPNHVVHLREELFRRRPLKVRGLVVPEVLQRLGLVGGA